MAEQALETSTSPADPARVDSNLPAFQQLRALTSTYLDSPQLDTITRAFHFAANAHAEQIRKSGEPYITHPVAAACILAEMHMDHHTVVAALLHDVIEDTCASKEELRHEFGNEVAELVDGVSKLTQIQFASRAEAQAENFLKMTMAMARDIRVILVKLADRLHNMRTLGVLQPEKRRRIARETLEIYAPIANRLGMRSLCVELEELGFHALHPMRARRIRAAIEAAKGGRHEALGGVVRAIEARLEQEQIAAKVIGREKRPYSVYQKMRLQRKPFHEIMDLVGVRILVDGVDTCYRVLGVLHNLYKPIPGRFKDYIAIPKVNGYQSLHTTLIATQGMPVELQMRTHQMDAMARHGIAAHWLYKANPELAHRNATRTQAWVEGLLEIQQTAGDSLEFIENVKLDLFPDEVYVFTPKGEILELPKGATAVDFAYAVHTDVGNTCVACRINGRLAPLSEPLQSGQSVKIITAPGAKPNIAWLNYAVSAKARTSIRHYLKHQRKSESVALGRKLLDKSLLALGLGSQDIPEARIVALLTEYQLPDFDALLGEIGLGNRMAHIIAHRLQPVDASAHGIGVGQGTPGLDTPLAISGTEGLLLNYARCCYPIPGDAVVGHLSSGRGITVHLEGCRNVVGLLSDPDRCIALRWDNALNQDFVGALRVEMENKRGMLATVATAVAASQGNIEKINTADRDGRLTILTLEVSVHDRQHMARILRRLRAIPEVSRVHRIKNSAHRRSEQNEQDPPLR
ncbi:MAG: RelA/SpoT family protein [Pseudomonadota bacterium]|nr:RelA/SpoT family protein [Pseudomonadota bacterium]